MNSIPGSLQTAPLLAAPNVFNTFAWYGHLKNLADKPWYTATLISRGIALFEYLLQVPGNRIGHAGGITLAQLKITQEVTMLAAFVPFATVYMEQPCELGDAWTGLCTGGAVYFISCS